MKIAPIEKTYWSNLLFSKSIKGDSLVEIHLRLAPLIQNVTLVLENICVKFDENSFNIMDAMAMSVFFKVLQGR